MDFSQINRLDLNAIIAATNIRNEHIGLAEDKRMSKLGTSTLAKRLQRYFDSLGKRDQNNFTKWATVGLARNDENVADLLAGVASGHTTKSHAIQQMLDMEYPRPVIAIALNINPVFVSNIANKYHQRGYVKISTPWAEMTYTYVGKTCPDKNELERQVYALLESGNPETEDLRNLGKELGFPHLKVKFLSQELTSQPPVPAEAPSI